MCIALVWWGANDLAGFDWTGGAFLRMDWLFCTVLGVCLMKRNQPTASGFALTSAAMLRVFPVFVMAGLGLKAVIGVWRARSLSMPTAHRQFAKGGGLAVVLLVPLSMAVVGGGVRGGIDAWSEFVTNSRKHLATPMANNVGLEAILSYKSESRMALLRDYWLDTPWDTWMIARERALEERKLLFEILVAAFVVLLAFVVHREDDWIALTLGTSLIVIAADPSCYYLSVLLVFGFL